MGVTDAEKYGDRFDEEVNQVQQYFLQKATSQEEAMELFSSHIDRIAEDIIRQETEKTRVQVPQRKGYVVPERARGLAVPTGLFKLGTQVAQPMTKEEVLAGPPMKRGGVTLRAEVLKADTHKVLREINLPLDEVKKLTWTPSEFKYQLGPYNWACASSLIDGTRIYRCVAEDTQGFMEKYIFIE
jgi:ribulose 1,5-bisphosphate synthetase/thiazole synthase